jgi:hypothetical protein
MTAYHGGKQKLGKILSKNIIDTSMNIENFEIKGYCEPFCGMLGVYQYIPDLFLEEKIKMKYLAGDTNKSVINMWKKTQKGWIPPNKTTEKEYNKLKESKEYSALKAYIGHQYSYGGQFFNGYAPKYGKNKDSTSASNRIVKIAEKLKDVKFKHGSYEQFSNLKGYIIYCDPPYENSWCNYNGIKSKNSFNNDKFWKWCNKMSKDNIIFVSSYTAPKNTECIFSISRKLTGDDSFFEKKNRVEKLYLLY